MSVGRAARRGQAFQVPDPAAVGPFRFQAGHQGRERPAHQGQKCPGHLPLRVVVDGAWAWAHLLDRAHRCLLPACKALACSCPVEVLLARALCLLHPPRSGQLRDLGWGHLFQEVDLQCGLVSPEHQAPPRSLPFPCVQTCPLRRHQALMDLVRLPSQRLA